MNQSPVNNENVNYLNQFSKKMTVAHHPKILAQKKTRHITSKFIEKNLTEQERASKPKSLSSESSFVNFEKQQTYGLKKQTSRDLISQRCPMLQQEGHSRRWLLKRGKRDQVYCDQKQMKVLEGYFDQIDVEQEGRICHE